MRTTPTTNGCIKGSGSHSPGSPATRSRRTRLGSGPSNKPAAARRAFLTARRVGAIVDGERRDRDGRVLERSGGSVLTTLASGVAFAAVDTTSTNTAATTT